MDKVLRSRLQSTWLSTLAVIISFLYCVSKSAFLHGTGIGLLVTVIFCVCLPGFLLSRLLGKQSNREHPIVRFIWSVACGIGLTVLMGSLLRLFNIPVAQYILLLHVLMLCLAIFHAPSKPDSSAWRMKPDLLPAYICLFIACVLVFVISYNQNRNRILVYDDQTIFTGQIAWLSNYSTHLYIYERTVNSSSGGLRSALDGWTYSQAVWSYVSGVSAADLFIHDTAPLLSWIIPLIYFAITYELTSSEYAAIWAALAAVLFGMLTLDDLTRQIQDVAFGQYSLFMMETLRKISTAFVLPLASLVLISLLRAWRLTNAVPFFLLCAALFVIHPRQAGLYLISVAATFIVHTLAQPQRKRVLFAKLVALLIIMAVAIWASDKVVGRSQLSAVVGTDQYKTEVEYILANPATVYGKYTILPNIPLIGTTPILSPDTIFYHFIVGLTVPLGLLQIANWRKSLAAQYIVATTASSLLIAFMPGVPAFFLRLFGLEAGRFFVGIVFIIPIPLILGVSTATLLNRLTSVSRLNRNRQIGHNLAVIVVTAFLLALLVEPVPIAYSTRDQMQIMEQFRDGTLLQSYDEKLLSILTARIPVDEIAHTVIAPGRLAGPIVESVPQALITTGRPRNPAYAGTQRFFNDSTPSEPWFDTADTIYINSLGNQGVYDVYIVAEANTARLPQLLMQPNRFQLLDTTAGGYFVFHVNQQLEASNTDNLFKEMNTLYTSVTQPRWTGRAFELQQPGDATQWMPIASAWLKALDQTPNDPNARYGLAFTYLMMGQDSKALPLWVALHQQFPDFSLITDALAYTQNYLGMEREGAETLLNALSSPNGSTRIMAVRSLLSEPFFYLLNSAEISRIIEETRRSSDAWLHLSGNTLQRIALAMSRDLWDVASDWFDMIPSTELSAKDLTTQAVALLAQGQVEQALNRLRVATDADWLRPKVFVHPDRWQNNIAAQSYYLISGEIALRENRIKDAEQNYQKAVAAGNRIAAPYFLSKLYQALARTTEAQEQLAIAQREWGTTHQTPLPELISLLSIADNRAVYVMQPRIVRGADEDKITLEATYGSAYGQAYPINMWRLSLWNLDVNRVYTATEVTPLFVDGALVRLSSEIKLPSAEQLPPLTPGRLHIDPLYNNRVIFGPRVTDVALNRPPTATIAPDSISVDAHFGSEIILKSYKVATSAETITLTLYWQAEAPPVDDYHVFVHVFDQTDHLLSQVDDMPVRGRYPTSQWRIGSIIADIYKIPLSQSPENGLSIRVGMYRLSDMSRLPVKAENYSVQDKAIRIYDCAVCMAP